MSYYLGKVGRAGARLVSSCKDLYYDVNAAYLTGAVDIIVVKQRDGSLKSTPFHVRFGKLGVLRTGDQKEVEIEINDCAVDLRMWIDESGRAFFVKKKATEDGSEGSSSSDRTREQSAAIDIPTPQGSSSLVQEPSRSRSGTQDSNKSTDSTPKDMPSKLDEGTPPCSLPSSELAMFERRYSEPVGVVGGGVTEQFQHEGEGGRGSGAEGKEGIACDKSAHELVTSSLPNPSLAIQIEEIGSLGYDFGAQPVLPDDYEVLSDSAVERERDFEGTRSARGLSALSDTEVEVMDRLSSKLWDWSDSNERPSHVSQGEPSKQQFTEEGVKNRLQPQPAAPVDRSGFWGALTGILKRRRRQRLSTVEDGIYLEDIDSDSMDPEELSQFFPSSHPLECTAVGDQANSSGIGSTPTLSPSQSNYDVRKEGLHKLVSTLDDIAFSLCGGLGGGTISEESFQNSIVSFEEFCRDPSGLFTNPKLVVRVEGKYYSWQVAAPMIMSAIVYLQILPMDTQKKLVNKHMPKKSRSSFWSFWGRGQPTNGEDQEKAKSEGGSPIGSPHKWMVGEDGEKVMETTGPPLRRSNMDDILSSDDDQTTSTKVVVRPRQRSLKRRAKQEFTNELTPDQLEMLPVRPGTNKVVFSITTKYQGTARAECTLYYWNYYDKIVVSDVDGTITRSDVAGQVLPFLGRDWTQNGVVELFNSVEKNGYKIVYLSARAIGQAGYTKDFLRKIRRGKASLPDGPLLLAPFSLYIAFRREVIEKRPEVFKIECLKQVKGLFSKDYNPFHAGFGNKYSDVKSYLNVGIPQSRIFTVNHKGVLKYELTRTFQSSYSRLMEFVDGHFPPLHVGRSKSTQDLCHINEEFNTFNYWRQPAAAVELPSDDV